MSPRIPQVPSRISNTMSGVLPQPSRIATICLARIKRKEVAGGTSNTRLWIGGHNMSECAVRRRKWEPHAEVDVRGHRDVAEKIERYSRDRVWNHYRGRDGLYAEQTNHDHGDPALSVVKCVHWAHMYHQNQRRTVKNMWKDRPRIMKTISAAMIVNMMAMNWKRKKDSQVCKGMMILRLNWAATPCIALGGRI